MCFNRLLGQHYCQEYWRPSVKIKTCHYLSGCLKSQTLLFVILKKVRFWWYCLGTLPNSVLLFCSKSHWYQSAETKQFWRQFVISNKFKVHFKNYCTGNKHNFTLSLNSLWEYLMLLSIFICAPLGLILELISKKQHCICLWQMLELEMRGGCVRWTITNLRDLRLWRVCWTGLCSWWRFHSRREVTDTTSKPVMVSANMYRTHVYNQQ